MSKFGWKPAGASDDDWEDALEQMNRAGVEDGEITESPDDDDDDI